MKQGFHESFERKEEIKLSSERSFCFWFAGAFAVITAIQIHKGDLSLLWPALGVISLVTGFVRPSLAAPLNRQWSKLGLLLARVTNPVVLFLIYYTTIVPIGLLMRACGKDPLRLERENAQSYWIARTPPGPEPETMNNQF